MKRLNKKLFRDMKQNKSQFINIFIMVFLGIFAYAGIHAYMNGMKISGENYYENYNLQDLWVSGVNFSEDDLNDIKKIENVNDAERILTVRCDLENYNEAIVEANFIETNNISKMYLAEGEEFSKEKDGVWFDKYLADNLNITVGDEIKLKYEGIEINQTVRGLVETPDHVYTLKDESSLFPTHKDFGYVYLSINESPIEMFNSIIVDVADTSKNVNVKQEIENNIKSAIAVTDRESSASFSTYNSEIKEGETYSKVFTFLFLFIAILSVITTMHRFIKKERTQIGTMKALGIKKSKITVHYINYGFYLSLLAVISGVAFGVLVIGNFFLNMEMDFFEVPEYSISLDRSVYILSAITVVIITLITYLSCRKILREPASEALRTEIPKVKNTKFDISKGIFKKASISTKWNLRDIARNKSRSLMAIVGVTGCTMLIVCALGMMNTMNSYLDWEFSTICNFEYKINLSSECTEDDLKKLIEKYGDNTSQSLGVEFKNNDEKIASTITVNNAKGMLNLTDHSKKAMELKDDGIYVTEKMAEKYGWKIGDEITWHQFGDETWYISKITALNRDPQSQSIAATKEYIESVGIKYIPDSMYSNEDLKDEKDVKGVNTFQSIENLRSEMESMLNITKTLVVLLIVLASALAFVIIYNLGVLSFSEKHYQFATLKVLGFKNKQIKKIFVKQNIWLSLVGIVVGLPLGYVMIDYVFREALGANYDFPAVINITSYIYSFVFSVIVTLLVNIVLSKKVKTIDMVTSLKANE